MSADDKYPGDGKGHGPIDQMNMIMQELEEFNKWLEKNPQPIETDTRKLIKKFRETQKKEK